MKFYLNLCLKKGHSDLNLTFQDRIVHMEGDVPLEVALLQEVS